VCAKWEALRRPPRHPPEANPNETELLARAALDGVAKFVVAEPPPLLFLADRGTAVVRRVFQRGNVGELGGGGGGRRRYCLHLGLRRLHSAAAAAFAVFAAIAVAGLQLLWWWLWLLLLLQLPLNHRQVVLGAWR